MSRSQVELTINEDETQTHAEAHLVMDNGTAWRGHGMARRHPGDPDVVEIGEKIAAARALSDLAHQLLDSATAKLEDVTHQRAHVEL
jgi:Rv2632c-like